MIVAPVLSASGATQSMTSEDVASFWIREPWLPQKGTLTWLIHCSPSLIRHDRSCCKRFVRRQLMHIQTNFKVSGAITGFSHGLSECIPRLRPNRFRTCKARIVIRITSAPRHCNDAQPQQLMPPLWVDDQISSEL